MSFNFLSFRNGKERKKRRELRAGGWEGKEAAPHLRRATGELVVAVEKEEEDGNTPCRQYKGVCTGSESYFSLPPSFSFVARR